MFNFPFMLEGEAAATTGGGNIWVTIGMLVLVVVVFYFLMIRPQKKREREANEMRDNLRVGDEVTTIGGIVGKIVSLRDETFVLETTKDKTHIRFLRAAIRSVDVRAEDSVDPTKKETEAEPQQTGKKNKKNKKNKAADQTEIVVENNVDTATTAVDIETTTVEAVSESDAPADFTPVDTTEFTPINPADFTPIEPISTDDVQD